MVEFDGEIIFETVNTWHSYRQNCVDGVNQMNINGWLPTDLERWLMPYFYVARCQCEEMLPELVLFIC